MHNARTGTTGFAEDLAFQLRVLEARCPPYARALELLPQVLGGRAGRHVASAWAHRRFYASYDRPLLLLAALRADARAEGPSHPLFAGFAAPSPDANRVTFDALTAGLEPARERTYRALTQRTVQTNETSRAVAWLWPAALAGASDGGRPVALADIGASAGLNLVADGLTAPWRLPDGSPLEVARGVRTVARLGLDASPLDAASPDDADWLRACIWPGEREREKRLEAALTAFAAARARPDGPVLLPVAIGDVLTRLDALSGSQAGALVIAYQTVVRDYIPPADWAEFATAMQGWLATHPPGLALWVELEADPGGEKGLSYLLEAHVRVPGGPGDDVRTLPLARCGPHPSVLVPDPAAVGELTAALRWPHRDRPAAVAP
jgi:hypothetical protein